MEAEIHAVKQAKDIRREYEKQNQDLKDEVDQLRNKYKSDAKAMQRLQDELFALEKSKANTEFELKQIQGKFDAEKVKHQVSIFLPSIKSGCLMCVLKFASKCNKNINCQIISCLHFFRNNLTFVIEKFQFYIYFLSSLHKILNNYYIISIFFQSQLAKLNAEKKEKKLSEIQILDRECKLNYWTMIFYNKT